MKNLNNYRGGGIYKTPLIETYLMPVEGGFLNSIDNETGMEDSNVRSATEWSWD